ncbi:MAG: DUF1080 domain-containing protein [Planctomycetes bacterium]|nr:DUF1080 domain-containing protein [Planctomycetota bacterium]
MQRLATLMFVALLAGCSLAHAEDESGFVSLFDGKTLDGWKVGNNASSFSVADGQIVAHGPRAHLFYVGDVADHNFKNFEFRCQVMTKPHSNSGLYFHTEYQEDGWPAKGYEAQVNNTHADRKKTGGLYAVQDVMDNSPAKDDEWFDYTIRVEGKRIILMINGKTTVDYTEPDHPERPKGMEQRLLSSGTFAIQAHDPGSETHIRNIRVKVLP